MLVVRRRGHERLGRYRTLNLPYLFFTLMLNQSEE